jgi:hypothetical protein
MHTIVIDEEPGPEGWGVVCIPHGPLGAWEDRVEAFLEALKHDAKYGGMSCR